GSNGQGRVLSPSAFSTFDSFGFLGISSPDGPQSLPLLVVLISHFYPEKEMFWECWVSKGGQRKGQAKEGRKREDFVIFPTGTRKRVPRAIIQENKRRNRNYFVNKKERGGKEGTLTRTRRMLAKE